MPELLLKSLHVASVVPPAHQQRVPSAEYWLFPWTPSPIIMYHHTCLKAILKWPQPTMIKELQHFLCFANFYRCFIRGFGTFTAPRKSMTKKGGSWLSCTPAAMKSFHDLKARFTSAPIPNPDRPFIVEVDASNTGIRAILSHPKLLPCTCSCKLCATEWSYWPWSQHSKSGVIGWREPNTHFLC